MGNILDSYCNCRQCGPYGSCGPCSPCCQQNPQQPPGKLMAVRPPQSKVHFQKPEDTYQIIQTQDYGQGPNPRIAKYSQFPKLTQQQIMVLQRERPLKQQKNLNGTPLNCFFLTNKRIWYEGQWKAGLPHGKGKAYFQLGTYYEGTFSQGYAECNDGIWVYPEGSYYRGCISKSKIAGRGVYYNAYKKVRYTGDWVNDKPEGNGVEQFQNGNIYEGQFKDGYKSGRGKFTWRNGMKYQGDFKLGYMWGNGRLKHIKGVFQGPFEKGKMMGNLVTFNTQTGTYKGPLKNGQMSGMGQFTWYDSKKYIGQFDKGDLNGTGSLSFPNGQVVAGNWEDGVNLGIDKITASKKV